MRETLIAIAIVVVLGSLGASTLIPLEAGVRWGTILMGVGFGLGVPLGVVYHVILRQALVRRGLLRKGWYWNPIALHHLVTPGDRNAFLPWFYAGGAAFVVLALGLAVFGLAMVGEIVRIRGG